MFLNVPFVIKQVTEEYITRNNYPLKFIRKYLHSVNIPGQAVAATEIYEMFKDWFRRGYPGKKVHDFEKFTKELSDEGYKSDEMVLFWTHLQATTEIIKIKIEAKILYIQ